MDFISTRGLHGSPSYILDEISLKLYIGNFIGKKTALNVGLRWGIYELVFPAALTAGLIYCLYKIINIARFNPWFFSTETKVKFNDVKGADEEKQELKIVVEFLKNPEKFSSLGGKLPKGILLVGPPGVGKSLLAKAVAGEAGVSFFSKSGSELHQYGARRVWDLFKLAKKNVPCVVFIDEFDIIGKQQSHIPIKNQLLMEMDGFKINSGIIVLAATNMVDNLDKAFLRPGRFDVEVHFSIPHYKGRKELFDHYLSLIRHQDIDVEKLARTTIYCTRADIENIVNQAALRAAAVGAKYVTTEHLEYAADKALLGPEKITKILDEETNKMTAYHEGGHAVVSYFTEHALPPHKVTIIAQGNTLGHMSYLTEKDICHDTKIKLLAEIDTLMGGRAAEELIFGKEKILSGSRSDLKRATNLAYRMVTNLGMSDEVGLSILNNQTPMGPQTANLVDAEVRKILHESYERAKNVLIAHKDKLRDLSEALIKYETLHAEEITSIMNGLQISQVS